LSAKCCFKAGLSTDNGLINGRKLHNFKAIIFDEESSLGPIKPISLIQQETVKKDI
jgi:hypothetical protein